MGSKLSPIDLRLYRRVDEVLHYIWDPIGIRGAPEARDEYHGYLPKVFKLLKGDADQAKIAGYLLEVEIGRMGGSETPQSRRRAHEVATLLLHWKKTVGEQEV